MSKITDHDLEHGFGCDLADYWGACAPGSSVVIDVEEFSAAR